jgi:hypothetical protein
MKVTPSVAGSGASLSDGANIVSLDNKSRDLRHVALSCVLGACSFAVVIHSMSIPD